MKGSAGEKCIHVRDLGVSDLLGLTSPMLNLHVGLSVSPTTDYACFLFTSNVNVLGFGHHNSTETAA